MTTKIYIIPIIFNLTDCSHLFALWVTLNGVIKMEKNYSDKDIMRFRKMGLLIAYYRRLNQFTQEQLAEYVDISPGYLSQVESQTKTQPISLDLLFKMADVFQIEPKQLLEFEK